MIEHAVAAAALTLETVVRASVRVALLIPQFTARAINPIIDEIIAPSGRLAALPSARQKLLSYLKSALCTCYNSTRRIRQYKAPLKARQKRVRYNSSEPPHFMNSQFSLMAVMVVTSRPSRRWNTPVVALGRHSLFQSTDKLCSRRAESSVVTSDVTSLVSRTFFCQE